MRLVLVAIGMHVRRGTPRAWPSVRTLEAATHLSRHTIIDHIENAIAEGWLHREKGRLDGMRYHASIYTLTLPSGAATAPLRARPSGAAASPLQGLATGAPAAPHGASYPQSRATGAVDTATGAVDAGQLVQLTPGTTSFQQEVRKEVEQGAGDKSPETRTAKPKGNGNGAKPHRDWSQRQNELKHLPQQDLEQVAERLGISTKGESRTMLEEMVLIEERRA